MKEQHPNRSEETLDRALREWRVESPVPPRFQESVWHRIERGRAQSFSWRDLLVRLSSAISRPSLAAGYLAVLLLSGLLAGYLEARSATAHAQAQLSARYVQIIDPYRNPAH
jgi:hypothetical protein